MQKIIAFLLLSLLILLNSSGIANKSCTQIEQNTTGIYQISPDLTKSILVSYKSNISKIYSYKPLREYSMETFENKTYLILSTDELLYAITSSTFITWKKSQGYNLTLMSVSDNLIQNQIGDDLSQKIRQFLREYQPNWNIIYLLIVGDITSIPMRYCYPNPSNHQFDIFNYLSGEVPTDYYYADLTLPDHESWDKDGDGFYGEFGQDQPDFNTEIVVGRIPTSNSERITYSLNKIVSFEQDDQDWKQNALHAGAFFYFENEDNTGIGSMDGAVLSHYIETDFMTDWTVNHYSEQDGLEQSQYTWDQLTEQNFINDWRTGKYSIVNWQGHGWTNAVARKVWTTDDGDGIPEGPEIAWPNFITRYSTLDDDYPSIVTAVSCYVGCPEKDLNSIGNLGIDLLTHPSFGAAVAVVASARSPYGSQNWPQSPGGSDQIIYEFNKNIIVHKMPIGDAFYESKYYCTTTYGWDQYYEYVDLFTFNLFGDPSMKLINEAENHRPLNPDPPNGPDTGKLGNEYNYTVSTTDPDNDQLFYMIDWGDGETSMIYGPYESGEECTVPHTWFERGEVMVRVKAIDENNAESEWSEPLPVSMSRTKIIHFKEIIIALIQKLLSVCC
jgi:hypothetical protein